MSNRIATFGLACILAGMTASASAMDGNTNFMVYGRLSCGKYLDARKANDTLGYVGWLAGYVTAANFYAPNTFDLLGSTDMPSALAWLEKHCRENPLRDFQVSVRNLLIELYPMRHVTKP